MKQFVIITLVFLCGCRKKYNCVCETAGPEPSYGQRTVAAYSKAKADEKCKAYSEMDNTTIPPTYALYCQIK